LNLNERAIDLFERNEYEGALELFRKAVKESRDIQSLNNLAWMYSYEEEDDEKALKLIKEVIQMNPISYFPYNILGEIYIRQKRWEDASEILHQSVSIQRSNQALQNLAVAKYYLGNLEDASDLFLLVAEDSDYAMYSHVKCLIDLGKKLEAKKKLDVFNVKADGFVGEIEVADLYVELGDLEEAIHWFEKGWKSYWKSPNWVGRFLYALFHTKNITRMKEVVHESIQQVNQDIKDTHEEECEENWTQQDKEAHLQQLLEEKTEYENMIKQISTGYTPKMEYEPPITGACYLFGCKQHQHPEYKS
jgi:tetratricopeptide (TPR) repeat protein